MNEQTGTKDATPVRKPLIATEIGRVVSDKMNKTVTVLVERRSRREQRIQGRRLGRDHRHAQAVEDQGVESLEVAGEGQSCLRNVLPTVAKRQNPGHNYRFPAAVSRSYEKAPIRGLLPGAKVN